MTHGRLPRLTPQHTAPAKAKRAYRSRPEGLGPLPAGSAGPGISFMVAAAVAKVEELIVAALKRTGLRRDKPTPKLPGWC